MVLIASFETNASPPQKGEVPAGFEVSDLAAARLLMKAGKFRGALAFLEQARPADEEENTERRFMLGEVYMRLGMPRKAVEQYEAILAIRPNLTRVRLELASALYVAGLDDRAKHHFELSLGDGLPSSIEAAVERILHAIDARKRWSVHVSAAVLPETNAGRNTKARTIDIGGAKFRLNEDARQAPGVGTQLSVGTAFSPKIAENIRGHLALATAAKLYGRSAWNDVAITAEAGLTRLFDGGSFSGGMRAGRRWIGSERFRRSIGPWVGFDRRISNRTRVGMRTNVDYRKHDDRNDLDGWRVGVNPSIRYVLDSQTTLKGDLHLEVIEARAKYRSSRLVGLSTGVSRAFKNGITVSTIAAVQLQGYRAEDSIFGIKREDKVARMSVSVMHGSLQIGGFAPYAGYSYERNRSNIALYDYRNHGVIMGLSREF